MTQKPTVLIIDDDQNNLRILELDLENDYNILAAKDGMEGWNIVEQHGDKIDVILLDRMMPNMDGMQFMERLTQDKRFSKIPVIMQTAAAEKEQIVEGIQSGVYYYLTKPYDKDIMLSVVSTAIQNYAEYGKLRTDLDTFKPKVHLIKAGEFEFRTLEEAHYLTTFIAHFFPDPERVVFGISELFINAIEHGNLNIGYDEKTALNKEGRWLDEISHRLSLKEFSDKVVRVDYSNQEDRVLLTVSDQGKGFNWKEYMEISPVRAIDNHGRGIAMSKMLSFDELEYKECGNQVECIVYKKL